MENISIAVIVLFVLTTIYTVAQFQLATGRSKKPTAIILLWMAVVALLGMAGFYRETTAVPPRFIFLIGPPMIGILLLFLTAKGKAFLDSLSLKAMTLL